MQADELVEKIKNIRTWQRGDIRAPHKPLLPYTLGRLSRGEPRLVSYAEAKEDLRKLLIEFGPYRKMHYPSYPFVKLCNDGDFWQLEGDQVLNTTKDWSDRELTDNHTFGGFTEEVYTVLKNDRKLLHELARLILDQYFDDTLQQDILAQVGLDLEEAKYLRSPDFRDRFSGPANIAVLFAVLMFAWVTPWLPLRRLISKWHCYGGPDCEENGIALALYITSF